MKSKYLKAYMQTAEIFAELSSAKRLHVGAIVVKDDRIISIGYNGMPSGWENDCETVEWCSAGGWLSPDEIEEQWPFTGTYKDVDGNEIQGNYRLISKPEVLHAESNAISKLAKSSESGDGAYMFITHAPCLDCAKLIHQSGINHVYFGKHYRDSAGIDFLTKCKVEITQL